MLEVNSYELITHAHHSYNLISSEMWEAPREATTEKLRRLQRIEYHYRDYKEMWEAATEVTTEKLQ